MSKKAVAGKGLGRDTNSKPQAIQTITPYLWFDSEAEEAAEFYTSVFENSRILDVSRYGKEGYEVHGRPAGSAMTVVFELSGQRFMALNGGPNFRFNEAISFLVTCKDQKEVDYFWGKLSAHPEAEQCGWLRDRYGLSWQVVPAELGKLVGTEDKGKAARVMEAMLRMKKLDIKKLRNAYQGK